MLRGIHSAVHPAGATVVDVVDCMGLTALSGVGAAVLVPGTKRAGGEQQVVAISAGEEGSAVIVIHAGCKPASGWKAPARQCTACKARQPVTREVQLYTSECASAGFAPCLAFTGTDMVLLLLSMMKRIRVSTVVERMPHPTPAYPESQVRTASALFTQPKVPWSAATAGPASQPFVKLPSQSKYLHK
jgi:hypothetical protein